MFIFFKIYLISYILCCVSALKDPYCADQLVGFGTCNTLITRIGYKRWENECTSMNFIACEVLGTSYDSIKECEDKCKE
ncbi:uncharacterized protein Sfp23F [Drosophila suzukii]|uniref:Uncharacterized protein Sfp23F n=1 Tax=Drosophila suzukii TaxID=28584 RepID=A0ABM4U093_DROSZ